MVVKPLLVFDMDGVLVDVTDSYREAIRVTVHHFSQQEITPELIQEYKNAGGWNNDWALSQKILADLGIAVDYDVVVKQFQHFFFGPSGENGLVLRERWIPKPGLLEKLSEKYDLAIFTGRLHDEADFSLKRFVPNLQWTRIMADDDVTASKPAPDGLLMIAALHPGAEITYVGDTIDDARSGRAAGVRFIGIAGRENPRRDELISILQSEGAVAILENVNELETTLMSETPNVARESSIDRNTKETQISAHLVIDGKGHYEVFTGIRFLDHMLELFTKHGGFDLRLWAKGDLDVDQHHTVEDIGIVLGQAVAKAIGDRVGINRAGYFVLPMDETLAVVALDLGGRAACVYNDLVEQPIVGDLQTELVEDFFQGFAQHAAANVHIKVMYGRSTHHKIEAIFKCFARALRYACSQDERLKDQLPSTKGLLV